MITSIATSNPDIAVGLAQTLSDEQQRGIYTTTAIDIWARTDFDSALASYETLPHSGSKLQALRVLGSAAFSRADGGDTITRLVAAVPEGDDRTRAVESLVIAAGNPRLRLSAESSLALRQFVGETTDLSAGVQAFAERLFSGANPPRGQP